MPREVAGTERDRSLGRSSPDITKRLKFLRIRPFAFEPAARRDGARSELSNGRPLRLLVGASSFDRDTVSLVSMVQSCALP